ncbi:MAG: ABC transporter ATP-binding protein [Xanthobacteraceae bacterium]|uniref:ABC transporter ATP-binding protein n=1 Tax=Pseudolabrys sp. TaxID=1960880 RepID=UPI003D10A16F
MSDLVIEDLRLRLGDHDILKGVSLTVPRGKITALLGPSGSGKTTLLRAVAGLEAPHAGSIRIGERVLFDAARGIDMPAEQRGLGLVFQSYALWPHRTVFDNIAYGLTLRRIGKAEIRERVETTLSRLGLGGLSARYPHQLSGGQQQRVALARALVYEPGLLLLDEPLSNLDTKLREDARLWLRQLIGSLNLSALCVTHDQTEAMAVADGIALLNDGTVEQSGTANELYNGPRTLFAAEFLGSNNSLPATLVENTGMEAAIDVDGHRLTGILRTDADAGALVTGVIRLERVRIADAPGPNRLPMTVSAQMYMGERWEIVFSRGNLTLRARAAERLRSGNYFIELPAKDLWIF